MAQKCIADIGEFGWIGRVARSTPASRSVRLGIGDDAAVVRVGGKDVLFTTDMLIEGRHFRLGEATAYEIGRKAMAVNLSDIAAMGGLPTHAVVSAGLPAALSVSFADEMVRGLREAAAEFGADIVGGDTNRSDKLILSVALLGEVTRKGFVTRAGAKKDDVVFVSGDLGGSYHSKKHLHFTPRVREAQFLLKHFEVRAMMDISDGLSSDLWKIARASGVGVRLAEEAIPVSSAARGLEEALTEGEDFELLFTLPAQDAARLTVMPEAKTGVLFSPIGRVVDKKFGVRILREKGGWRPLKEKGFDHFKK